MEWGGVFEQWARRWVSKNHWRVAHTIGDREDCLQECALIFTRCLNRYKTKVDNPAWFMALFKVAVANTWILLSKRDTRARPVSQDWGVLDARGDPSDSNVAFNDGPLLAALHEASDEVRTVLETIANAPAEALGMMFGKTAAKTNIRLRRMCNLPGRPDIVGELRSLLSPQGE